MQLSYHRFDKVIFLPPAVFVYDLAASKDLVMSLFQKDLGCWIEKFLPLINDKLL